MSKLSQIRQALKNNPRVKIVKVWDNFYLPTENGRLCHNAHLRVAPAEGSFSDQEMRQFIDSLVPELNRSNRVSPFRDPENNFCMRCAIFFEEPVGVESSRSEFVLTDADMILATPGFVDGKGVIENVDQPLMREIMVSVYEDVLSATRWL